MRRLAGIVASIVLALSLPLASSIGRFAADVTVFAAASLKEALDEQAQAVRGQAPATR